MTRSGTDLGTLTAGELLRLYRERKASPVEAARAALERVARFNSLVNAYCHLDEEAALAAARESEARWMSGTPAGLLDGIPASVKDLTPARGMPTRKGSLTTDARGSWDVDAPFTAHLRKAGAVLLGKTTTPEFGWKGVTDSPLTGVTRNPWNAGLTPGGSSGGACTRDRMPAARSAFPAPSPERPASSPLSAMCPNGPRAPWGPCRISAPWRGPSGTWPSC
jgi:aspartyl-tRNA(Asn)/glutamyl-tRNA(Gln) amidotransferase subunit A